MLAKAGYCGGDPEIIAEKDCDWVMKMYHYHLFCQEYEQEIHLLNSKNS
jgi:hypothetical protein